MQCLISRLQAQLLGQHLGFHVQPLRCTAGCMAATTRNMLAAIRHMHVHTQTWPVPVLAVDHTYRCAQHTCLYAVMFTRSAPHSAVLRLHSCNHQNMLAAMSHTDLASIGASCRPHIPQCTAHVFVHCHVHHLSSPFQQSSSLALSLATLWAGNGTTLEDCNTCSSTPLMRCCTHNMQTTLVQS